MLRWVLWGAALGFGAVQPQLSLNDVVRRVGTYVEGYGDRASVVVCTETYEQHADASTGVARKATLVSDFALVYADSIPGWLGFRDVIAVNDRSLPDREDRLARVLMGAEGRFDEARRLQNESARFNVGGLQRNFNLPTSALFYFVTHNHDRFKFAARRVLEEGTWEIAYHETGRPTLIRTPEGDSVPTTGTIWVRPQDGAVVRTLLEVDFRKRGGHRGKGWIDVRYQHVDTLGMWLPASMDESFQATKGDSWDKVTGHAEYANYRRFETSGRIKK